MYYIILTNISMTVLNFFVYNLTNTFFSQVWRRLISLQDFYRRSWTCCCFCPFIQQFFFSSTDNISIYCEIAVVVRSNLCIEIFNNVNLRTRFVITLASLNNFYVYISTTHIWFYISICSTRTRTRSEKLLIMEKLKI
jgi:hypothetical protein